MDKSAFIAKIIRLVTLNKVDVPQEKLRFIRRYVSSRILHFFKKPIKRRNDLPALLASLGLNGKAVEVGVRTGYFSRLILEEGFFSCLYSVDPWKEADKDEYKSRDNVFQEEQEERYRMTVKRLKEYKERSKILRMTSFEASKLFDTNTLDFVYIDANHEYEECKKDLELWWPKVKKGGVFAGHDYINGMIGFDPYGVKKAVDELSEQYKQRLFVMREKWPTWYLVKK